MKKKTVLSLIFLAIILSMSGCSEILRPLTVSYKQCEGKTQYTPKTAEEFVTYSRMHYDKGEYDCAYAAAEEAYRRQKNDAALIARGYAHFGLKEYANALSDFRTAIWLGTKDPDAFWGRALVFTQHKDWDNAIADYTKVIELSSDNSKFAKRIPYFLAERGKVFFKKGDYENSVKDFSKAIELAPEEAIYYDYRAKAYQQSGKTNEASADEVEAAKIRAARNEKAETTKSLP